MSLRLTLIALLRVSYVVLHEAEVSLNHPHVVLLLPCHVFKLGLIDFLLRWLAIDLFIGQLAHLLVASMHSEEEPLDLLCIRHKATDQFSVVAVRLRPHRLD